MSPHPIAPPWLVLPLGAIAMFVIAGYLLALRAAPPSDFLPPSRRRIRTLSGLVSMVTVGVLAYGFGVAAPAHARTFLLVWIVGTFLVGLVLLLALIDLADTYRLRRAITRPRLRELAEARSRALRAISAQHAGPLAHARPADDDTGPDR